MIRIFGLSLALTLAGSGLAMAQAVENRTNQPEKVAMRLERPRAQMTPEAPVVPANAVLDSEGRIVPMRPVTIGGDDTAEPCSGSRKLRPAEVRVIAAREPASPRPKERQSASPAPRWASGFVFNLE